MIADYENEFRKSTGTGWDLDMVEEMKQQLRNMGREIN